jgi:hypothetical protein
MTWQYISFFFFFFFLGTSRDKKQLETAKKINDREKQGINKRSRCRWFIDGQEQKVSK